MRTVEEHRAVVAGLLSPLPVEEIALADAHGRVLARDVPAPVALPGFDNSAMDGYAARWAEVSTAAESPVRLPVADDIPAGRTDVFPLAPGTVQRIMTGAPLPAGADVVIPVELTDGGTDLVEIRDVLPARMSSPAVRRWLPTGRTSRISTTSVPPSVSSTGITTSAPAGSGAPVMIRWTVPGARGTTSVRPAGMSSATGSRTGDWAAVDTSAQRAA